MTEPLVYLNPGFLPASHAKLNIHDLGSRPPHSPAPLDAVPITGGPSVRLFA